MNDDQHHEPTVDDLATELALDDVLAALAARDTEAPPPDLRASLLRSIASRPRRPQPADPRVLYRRRAAALADLLAGLAPAAWNAVAEPYVWTVHGLVAHLLQVERHTATVLGCSDEVVEDSHDHLATGGGAIADELTRAPAETAAAWFALTERIAAHVERPGYDPHAPAALHGLPFDSTAVLVARSFEIWTHGEDICRAVGRAPVVPDAAELRTMSTFSVGSLPANAQQLRPGLQVGPVRIVLTGDGGGTFDLGQADGPSSLLVADVVDYCRVAARRIAPGDLAGERSGDLELLDDLLVVAGAFAM